MTPAFFKTIGGVSLASFVVLAAACGPDAATPATTPAGSSSAPTPPTSASAAATMSPTATASSTASAVPTTVAAAPTSWSKDLTKEQQMAFMKTKIVPAMGPAFQAHDAKRYGDFGCKTCHGPEYKDPKDYLPHLTLKGGKLTAFTEKPAVAKFMAEVVSPKMADAMGLPHYDEKTHQGFGCGGCHTIDMK